ncbi:hypothetical protein BCR33DRAFT_180015 [Rhizoclosmatium globosum]|uniref:RING-type domain-containing protein n=1 Tax=Rhizoclosmatium globosum TaxID=329046 RepID=A0A1Y2D2P6_9FUNG|nr:hypothetical protein BCR33DRAFT_180015 [Rhizoclosmatium globosum]|eukprot:ORY52845.1 hypothetical protein BCR33DRAFT_180015 [Rhizoclosmatium globosum]
MTTASPTTISTSAPSRQSASLPPEFDDMFKCYLCFDSLTHPVMCPSCSKIGCGDCVQKWLATNRHCPHCRAHLTPENLVLCRFMDDLAKQVRDAMSATLRNASHPQTPSSNPADVCSTHNAPLFYFCHPCQTALCSDCAILTDTHKQHHIDHLQAVYSTHRDKLWSCLKSLFQSLKHLAETRSQVDTQLSALHAAKVKVQQKHQKQMQAAQDFLELQFTAKASILQKFDREVEHEVTRIQDTVQDMQTHLKVSSKMEVIQKSASILEIVEREHGANSKWGLQGSGASVPLVAKTFQSTLIPAYESSVMKIPDFMQRIQNTTIEADAALPNGSLDVIYSEPFRASGVEWKLKVYCNGNKGTHLSVFVLMLDGYPAPSKYQYAIELVRKTQSSEPATAAHNEPDTSGVKSTREFISEFSPGECWGYTKFYPLELFPSSGFLSPEDGSLEIKFSVRAMDYAQRCRDLQWRLDKVEGGNNTVSTEACLKNNLSLFLPLFRHRKKNSWINRSSYLVVLHLLRHFLVQHHRQLTLLRQLKQRHDRQLGNTMNHVQIYHCLHLYINIPVLVPLSHFTQPLFLHMFTTPAPILQIHHDHIVDKTMHQSWTAYSQPLSLDIALQIMSQTQQDLPAVQAHLPYPTDHHLDYRQFMDLSSHLL